MFTGIVTEVGTVRRLERAPASAGLEIEAPGLAGEVVPGDSVAVDGACLTVTSPGRGRLAFDVVTETLKRTTLGSLGPGRRVNLEGALRVGDRLSGHFVMGHVDGVGEVVSRQDGPGQVTLRVRAPDELAHLLLEKGSIALSGVSLTTWGVRDAEFSVALVPHTLRRTTLRDLRPGDRVNLEGDVLARWLARTLPPGESRAGLTLGDLRRAGYEVD